MLHYFENFFDKEMIDLVVEETNRYANQSGAVNWTPVTSDEIKLFLAITVLQGAVQKPTLQMYWTKDHLLKRIFFRKSHVLQKVSKNKDHLHLANNEAYDLASHPNSKLNKVWSIYCRFVEKCKNSYTPVKNLTIYETLLLYKRRLGWVQYISLKRICFGIRQG